MALGIGIKRVCGFMQRNADTNRRQRILQQAALRCMHVHVSRGHQRQTGPFANSLQHGKTYIVIGTAQQFMYRSPSAETVAADDFLPALCRALADAGLPEPSLAIEAPGVGIGNDVAVPLALLVAEVAGMGGVCLRLEPGDGATVLVIEGAAAGTAGWSAPLLRGLARQMGVDLPAGSGGEALHLPLPRGAA